MSPGIELQVHCPVISLKLECRKLCNLQLLKQLMNVIFLQDNWIALNYCWKIPQFDALCIVPMFCISWTWEWSSNLCHWWTDQGSDQNLTPQFHRSNDRWCWCRVAVKCLKTGSQQTGMSQVSSSSSRPGDTLDHFLALGPVPLMAHTTRLGHWTFLEQHRIFAADFLYSVHRSSTRAQSPHQCESHTR